VRQPRDFTHPSTSTRHSFRWMKEAGKMPWKKEESVTETVTVMDESRRESE